MQEVMRETSGWSELGFSPGLMAIIQFGWDTTEAEELIVCHGGKGQYRVIYSRIHRRLRRR